MSAKKWTNNTCVVLLGVTVLLLIAFPAIIIFIGDKHASPPHPRYVCAWIVAMALLLLFCVVCGKGISGLATAVLIDDRNVMSLSRIQMLIWTLLFLSGFIVAALINMHAASTAADPTAAITIPPNLVILMGISTTSLVASPLILSTKKDQTPAPSELQAMQLELNQQTGVSNDGKVATNTSPSDARWSDLFTGEEVGNAANVDLSRVQMFFFTVIVAAVYAVMLGHQLLLLKATFTSFPDLDPTLLSLIAISHGGYLTAKALPHTKSADASGADATQGDKGAPIDPAANAVG